MGSTSKRVERVKFLTNLMIQKDQITISEAMRLLNVSEATVRRLFREMEENGVGIRSYGSLRKRSINMGYSFETESRSYSREKQRIGRLAVSYVTDGDTIYLDCGTTTFQMTLALSERIAAGDFRSLNIVTNSIVNVQALGAANNCHIILVGGEYSNSRRDFSGALADRFIEALYFDKCFVGCDGVTLQSGFATKDVSISSLNSCIIKRADFVGVLCDSSKFGKSAPISYAKLNEIDCLITDSEPKVEFAAALEREGIRLVIAEEK